MFLNVNCISVYSFADTFSFADQLQMRLVGWCVEPTHSPGLLTGFRFRLREGVGCLAVDWFIGCGEMDYRLNVFLYLMSAHLELIPYKGSVLECTLIYFSIVFVGILMWFLGVGEYISFLK